MILSLPFPLPHSPCAASVSCFRFSAPISQCVLSPLPFAQLVGQGLLFGILPSPNLIVPLFKQVSLAVLLDNFVAASARLEAREAENRVMEQKALRQFRNPLEPLIVRSAFG